VTSAPLTFTGSSTLQFASGITLPSTRSIVINSGINGSFDTNGFTVTNDSSISGAGTFVKTGAGTLMMSGMTSNSGSTLLDKGTMTYTVASGATGAIGFGSASTVTSTGTIDLGAFSDSFGGLTASDNSGTANILTIEPGTTLTINGNVAIGAQVANATAKTVLTLNGGGSLLVNASGGTFNVGQNTAGGNDSTRATVDLSALASFTANLGSGSLTIQPSGDNRGAGLDGSALTLSNTANAITAATINVGASGTGEAQSLLLGAGTNALNTTTLNLGTGSRDSGLVQFAGVGGTVVLRALDGLSRAAVTLGPTASQSTGYITATAFDTTGHSADLAISTLAIDPAAKTANNTNDFKFDQGTLDIKTVNMATAKGTGSSINTITIGGGTVLLGGSAAFSDTGTGSVTLANAATGALVINGGTVTSSVDIKKATSGTGTAILTLAGGTLDMTGHNIGGSTAIDTLNFQTGTLQNVASINVTGGVTKTTTGTLTLAGSNAFTGGVTLSTTAGQLNINSATALGASAGVLTIGVAGTVLDTTVTFGSGPTSQLLVNNNPQAWNGDFTFTGTQNLNMGTGAVALSDNRQVTVSANTLTVGGAISGTGFGLTKLGAGTLALGGANTYDNGVTVGSGILSVNSVATGSTPQPLGINTGASAVTLGVAGTSSGVLQYTGGVGTLDKNITAVGNGSDAITNAGTGALTLSGTLTKNGTVLALNGGANGINVTGPITGASAGSDLIVGPGTTTLANASNDYNGPTTVQSTGKLVVTGAITGTGNTVTVQSGGVLAGSGSIASAVSLSGGGTITAGSGNTASDSVGKLTMTAASGNELAASGTTTYDWKYASATGADTDKFTNAGTNWDVLAITNLSVTGTVDVVPIAITGATSFTPGTSYQFDIATHVGANYATLVSQFHLDTTALATAFAPAVGASGGNFSIDSDAADGGEIYVNYTPAPEPTSMMLLGLGVSGLALRRRRRRARTTSDSSK
jgi:autotransporter-associated beta strand protein